MAGTGQVTTVSSGTEEFSKIEYLLQLSLDSTQISDLEVWSVNNPHLMMGFSRKTAGKLVVESWVDVTTLGESNPVQEVCARGFRMPDTGEGLTFATGTVDVGRHSATQQFLLCDVGVGRSYVLDDPSKRDIPSAYDSLYIHRADEDAGDGEAKDADKSKSEEKAKAKAYHHEYIVVDPAQIAPRYVVHFTYDPSAKPPEPAGISAEEFGSADHPGVLVEKQKRILTDLMSQVSGALSVLGPSAGDATTKMLNEIGVAYETAVHSATEPDRLLEERKRALREAISGLEGKFKAIEANQQSVEEAIYDRVQEALFQLQDETQRKLAVLLGEELELRRQLNQIEWGEAFLKKMMRLQPPLSFIQTWKRHEALRPRMYDPAPVVGHHLDSILPDMHLIGGLEVVSESARAAASRDGSGGSTAAPGGGHSHSLPPSRTMDLALTASGGTGAAGYEGGVGGGGGGGMLVPSSASSVGGGDSGSVHRGGGMRSVPSFGVAASPAAAGAVRDIWNSSLNEHMGGASPRQPPRAPSGDYGSIGAGPGLYSEGDLSMARAQHAALEAASAHFPKHVIGPAKDEAAARLDEVKAQHAERVQASAAAYLKTKGDVATGRLHDEISTPRGIKTTSASMMSPSTGRGLSERLSQFSLVKEAARRKRQHGRSLPPALAFADSRIVKGDQAMNLFLCLPFTRSAGGGEVSLPVPQLLFASYNDVPATLNTFANNNLGMSTPSIVLVRANGYVFGGYNSTPWQFDDLFGGDAKSFLFSVTRDCKIPYHGRVKGGPQPGDDHARAAYDAAQAYAGEGIEGYRSRPWVRIDAARSTLDTLEFGVGDLVLKGELKECSSSLENAFGFGLRPDSEEARNFLAGSPRFSAEIVEIWAINPSG